MSDQTDDELLEELHFMSLHRASVRRTTAGFLCTALARRGIRIKLIELETDLLTLAMAMENSKALRQNALEVLRANFQDFQTATTTE